MQSWACAKWHAHSRKGAPSQLVIYHHGSLRDALIAFLLLRDNESAIVALTNTLALNDTPDWVDQLVLEELLEVPDRNDYVAAAETSIVENVNWYSSTIEELTKDCKPDTSPKNPEDYTGTYWDAIHIVKINLFLWRTVLCTRYCKDCRLRNSAWITISTTLSLGCIGTSLQSAVTGSTKARSFGSWIRGHRRSF